MLCVVRCQAGSFSQSNQLTQINLKIMIKEIQDSSFASVTPTIKPVVSIIALAGFVSNGKTHRARKVELVAQVKAKEQEFLKLCSELGVARLGRQDEAQAQVVVELEKVSAEMRSLKSELRRAEKGALLADQAMSSLKNKPGEL